MIYTKDHFSVRDDSIYDRFGDAVGGIGRENDKQSNISVGNHRTVVNIPYEELLPDKNKIIQLVVDLENRSQNESVKKAVDHLLEGRYEDDLAKAKEMLDKGEGKLYKMPCTKGCKKELRKTIRGDKEINVDQDMMTVKVGPGYFGKCPTCGYINSWMNA